MAGERRPFKIECEAQRLHYEEDSNTLIRTINKAKCYLVFHLLGKAITSFLRILLFLFVFSHLAERYKDSL